MSLAPKTILGIRLDNRSQCASMFQEVLTRHGCCIKTRIGLHDVSDTACAPSGLILLELHGASEDISQLERDLQACPAVQLKKMVFDD